MIIQGKTGPFELVIGLEVHAQVTSKSKLFSGASTDFGANPNDQVSFVDAGFPGMLPVINMVCVEQAVRTGLAIGAKINLTSVFDRKNYFYQDLPSGYQISQFKDPIVGEGVLDITLDDGTVKTIGIERIHLEQDAGKSLHDQHPSMTFVDLNRAGIALMEIVSKPDMRSPEEAGAYVKKLRQIVRAIGSCDGNMDEGSMRADANVSVRRPGEALGTRCEIKNVNSIRFMMQAITYEANRQVDLIEAGEKIIQETRLFDAGTGRTESMRGKEDAHDYRYFPCPDLLPLHITQDFVDGIKASMPELPDAQKARFISDYGLAHDDAFMLTSDKSFAVYYEECAKLCNPKRAANWVVGELFAMLNKTGTSIEDAPISAARLGGLVKLIDDELISGKIAKDIFAMMLECDDEALHIVNTKGLAQVSNSDAIATMIGDVLKENADKVAEYKSGKDKLFGFFIGQIMKRAQGKANPEMVNTLLKEMLGG